MQLLIDRLHPDMAKKIIKDFKLPFNYLNPSHFAAMVENMLQVAPEFNDAVDMMMNICIHINREDQPVFCGYIREVTELMVEHITHNTGYQNFNQRDINLFFPVEQQNIPTGDNYNYENAGKDFISIDLKNAAFQAMKTWDRLYGKEHGYLIGEYTVDYKEFVKYVVVNGGYTTKCGEYADVLIDYVGMCKSLRQVIFGKTNPKRIMHIEKFIMQSVVKLINSTFNIMPVRFNNDEVVYEYNEQLERSLYEDNSLKYLHYAATDTAANRTTLIQVPMEFHKNLYCLEEYSLLQHDHFMPIEHKKPVKFYVKNNVSMLTRINQAPDFKSLPAQLYLIARALFCSRPDLASFFETQPVLVDGVLHWLAVPYSTAGGNSTHENTWELRGNIHNNESEDVEE